MAVRIYLEIGHEASIRTKKTQEGFTHDWEVFVRGCEGAEIHYYIEKVVFYLHETFPKPKRVVKEPPYSVKESGYAGFNLPIDIYLRNNNEPKKIRFNYDLNLQQSGPPILKVQKEKYVFNSPTDEFKMKLLKGGGMIGSSSSIPEITENRSSFDDKNQMTNKPKLGGCDLIKKPKIKTGEPRDFQELFGSPITMSSKNSTEQKLQPKVDGKPQEKSRTKHSPHKDGHKDKEKSKDKPDSEKKSKEEKKQKEKSKDRERSKDKSLKKEKSPRPKSPSPKRSPKRSSPSRFASPPVVKHKEQKHDKEKREKQEEKKAKKERRSKEHKENKHGDEVKSGGNEEHKEKVKNESKKDTAKVKNENSASPTLKVPEKKEKSKEKSLSKEVPKDEKASEKSYSEKYKHKKKDKEKKEKKEEKSYKNEKKSEKTAESKTNLFKNDSQSNKKEKSSNFISNTAVPNIDESSNSSSSSSNSSVVEKKPKIQNVKVKEEKNQKLKKEKGYQENTIKCKRKSNSAEVEEPPEKLQKEHINNVSDAEQEVQGKTVLPTTQEDEEDYFGVLRDLQHKIMGLKDNSDLQKVVKLIAETGRYEVSAHTFDFDLCLLDRSTVQQLQDFFASET